MWNRFAVLAILAPLLAGCDQIVNALSTNCTNNLVAGIRLELADARDGGPVDPEEIEVVAIDGAYADTARVLTGSGVNLAVERAGIYAIEAEAAGFLPWDTSGVVVRDGECHVRTAELTAELAPSE